MAQAGVIVRSWSCPREKPLNMFEPATWDMALFRWGGWRALSDSDTSIIYGALITYSQSRKVGKCVPARLVLKPNLPTFRSGQSSTPHGLPKEQASLSAIFQACSPWQTLYFFPRTRRTTPHPGNGHPAPLHAQIRGSSGSFIVLAVLEENTFTVGPGTASTWGEAIPPCR